MQVTRSTLALESGVDVQVGEVGQVYTELGSLLDMMLRSDAVNRAKFILVSLIFVTIAGAQDLPPGVLLLSHVKNHIKDELERLSTVSCIETIHREMQPANGKMKPLDTVRLEVLTNGDKELFASPGDRKFSENHPLSYAGSGMLSNGLFGLYLKDILASEIATIVFRGEATVGARHLVRYDYRIPILFSAQRIQIPEGSGRVGLHGSFWVDPLTYDVVRLELAADDFPPTLPVAEMTTRIDYAPTHLASELMVLLPYAADSHLVKESGEISHNQIEFTHCRVFGAESTVLFRPLASVEQTPSFATASVDDTLRTLPAGLTVALKLRSRISGDMAVGALIEGLVVSDVSAKRAVVIPAGSPARGRIRRMERYTDPFSYFIVGLEFTEVEVQGIRYMFYADLIDLDRAPGVELILSTKNTTTTQTDPLLFGGVSALQRIESVSLYHLPGVAMFFYKGDRLELPQDFRTVWKTKLLRP